MKTNREQSKELEKEYVEALRDFAMYYVAIWNALKTLGMTDPQVKGAISYILDHSGGTMKNTVKEATQDVIWKEIIKNRERDC